MAYAIIGARQELAAFPALIARTVFLAVILFVFSQLWDTVFAEVGSSQFSTRDLLWYLAVTEWVMLSFPASTH